MDISVSFFFHRRSPKTIELHSFQSQPSNAPVSLDNQLIDEYSDQQTPSINLQTARETPVIHPLSPAFAQTRVATLTTTYVTDVEFSYLIGQTSAHQYILLMGLVR